jgi:hypothetical protein
MIETTFKILESNIEDKLIGRVLALSQLGDLFAHKLVFVVVLKYGKGGVEG